MPISLRKPRPAFGRAVAAAALSAGLLAGCAGEDARMKVCPRVAVLTEAGTLTRFEPGPGRDILDITFQVDVGDIIASCTFSDSKEHGRRVVVQVAPVFVLDKGSANADGKAAFTYFVSVVRNGTILTKQPFDQVVEFAANRSRAIVREDTPPIEVDIPLAYKAAEYEYEVLVGIQLTADELAYNRRWQGLGR